MPGSSAETSIARGTLLLMLGQLAFMVAGYAINILLALRLGPENYGVFSVVLAILVWVELFVINGVPTAMQRFIASATYDHAALARLGFKLQLGYCVAVWLVFVVATPLIAGFFADANLSSLLWIASLDILVFGMYWLYTGVLSGERRFAAQAVTIVSYAFGRLAVIASLVLFNQGVAGALIGNWLGSGIGLLVASRHVRFGQSAASQPLHYSLITKYAMPIVLYTISISLLLYLDIFFVKRYLTNADVGYYGAASTIARVPYFVFLAFSFTLLPVLSRAIASGEMQQARKQITQVMRFLIILLVPLVVFVWQNAGAIIRLLYSSQYDSAGLILPILTLALAIFTMFSIVTTVLNADGKPGLAFGTSVFAAAVGVVANMVLVPKFGTVGAAASTALASFSGLVCSSVVVIKRFHTFVSAATTLRVALAGVIAAWVVAGWQVTPVLVVPKAVVFMLIYGTVLSLVKEIRSADYALLRNIKANRRSTAQA